MATDSLMLHPSKRGGLCPSPWSWFWEISVTALNNQIQHRNGAVPVLGSRLSEADRFISLGMLMFRILPVRTQLPCWKKPWPCGKTTYWCSSNQPQIRASPKASINCQSLKGDILDFQLCQAFKWLYDQPPSSLNCMADLEKELPGWAESAFRGMWD